MRPVPGIGTIAGLVLGGNKKETTGLITFKDGRKLLASLKTKHFRVRSGHCRLVT